MTILRDVESAFRERGSLLVGGRYRLHEQLGGDDRSQVWRDTDEVRGRIVAYVEAVSVYVHDQRAGADACGAATAIARAVVAKLPAPS